MEEKVVNKFNWKFYKDPLFYFCVALIAGESSLVGVFEFNSSVMYILMFIGVLLMSNKKYIAYKGWNIVYVFYLYILLRNITFNTELYSNYWFPNFFTLVLFVIMGNVHFCEQQVTKIMDYIFFLVSIFMVLGIIKAIFQGGDRLAVFGGPNGYYKFTMLFESWSFIKQLQSGKKRYYAYMIVGLILTLLTGSRGGIVTICIILFLQGVYYLFVNNYSWNQILVRITKMCAAIVMIIIVCAVVIQSSSYVSYTFERGMQIFLSDNQMELTSVSARMRLYLLAWEYFCESPVLGKGALYLYFDTKDTIFYQPYVHNVFLEVLSEQGLIGIVLLFAIIIKLLRLLKKNNIKNYEYFGLYLVFLIYFIGAQFSGNILDSKVFLFFCVMIINYKKINCARKKNDKRIK